MANRSVKPFQAIIEDSRKLHQLINNKTSHKITTGWAVVKVQRNDHKIYKYCSPWQQGSWMMMANQKKLRSRDRGHVLSFSSHRPSGSTWLNQQGPSGPPPPRGLHVPYGPTQPYTGSSWLQPVLWVTSALSSWPQLTPPVVFSSMGSINLVGDRTWVLTGNIGPVSIKIGSILGNVGYSFLRPFCLRDDPCPFVEPSSKHQIKQGLIQL